MICETSAFFPCKLWLELANEFKSYKSMEEQERGKKNLL